MVLLSAVHQPVRQVHGIQSQEDGTMPAFELMSAVGKDCQPDEQRAESAHDAIHHDPIVRRQRFLINDTYYVMIDFSF